MMNPVTQTKPTSEELREEVNELRSTAAHLIEQASRLMEPCAHREDLISRGTIRANHSHDIFVLDTADIVKAGDLSLAVRSHHSTLTGFCMMSGTRDTWRLQHLVRKNI